MTRAEARQRELQLLIAFARNAEEREEIEVQLREVRGYMRGWDKAVEPVAAVAETAVDKTEGA
jgi:hypothetical protein